MSLRCGAVARLCGLALVAWFLPSVAAAERVAYTIAIGNNVPPAGDAQLAHLRYADDDAVRYYELLGRARGKAALLTVLDADSRRRHGALESIARPPTVDELQRALGSFKTAMQADRARGDEPVLVLTFSGHGSVDAQGRYFLAFMDGELTQQRLYEDVLGPLSGFETHLIVDACHAAGVVGARGPFDKESDAEAVSLGASEEARAAQALSLSRFPFVGALLATSSGQEAHEWSRVESGVFTHQVISALMGAADINGDLRIEYSEIEAFVAASSRSVTDPRAVPSLLVRPPASSPHAALIDLDDLSDTVLLTGRADELGRFAVNAEGGRRLLDAHVAGRERVVIALPRQGGLHLERGGREAQIPAHDGAVPVSVLSFGAAASVSRGAIDRSLHDGLFRSAYTRDYYAGFVDSHRLVAVDLSSPPRQLPLSPVTGDGEARVDGGSGPPAWVPIGLLAISGAATVVATIGAVLAVDARREFNRTDLQRRAHELSDDFDTYRAIAWTGAAVAATAGASALIVLSVTPSERPEAGISIYGRF